MQQTSSFFGGGYRRPFFFFTADQITREQFSPRATTLLGLTSGPRGNIDIHPRITSEWINRTSIIIQPLQHMCPPLWPSLDSLPCSYTYDLNQDYPNLFFFFLWRSFCWARRVWNHMTSVYLDNSVWWLCSLFIWICLFG